MRKRLVFAALCILAVPPLFSPSQNYNLTSPAPFGTVALAGRTTYGGWCECGAPECLCDPGEVPIGQGNRAVSDDPDGSLNQGATSESADQSLEFDFSSGALIIALGLFLWSRLRV